jgi:diketogulonate reductase-like aldo/keto reductase
MAATFLEPAVTLATGASMPLLGFGTWQIRQGDALDAVTEAFLSGYRHIDTATMYKNEQGVGDAIREAGIDRDDLFITTKLPPEHAGHEQETLEHSLKQLGLDHLDLWLIHWPPAHRSAVATWKEFATAQQDGLATSIGVSNFSIEQIDELIDATGIAPAVNQVKWGPTLYDPEFAAALSDRGVVLEGYSPFKTSNLADPTLVDIAAAHDADAAQIIVAWHIAHGFVVIPKSVKPERIQSNALGAAIELSQDEVARIDALGR